MTASNRMLELIAAGGEFTASDVTDRGRDVIDPSHRPNGANNGIGAMFAAEHRAGHIEPVGVRKSTSPHRKGGLVRTWRATDRGRVWAADVLAWRNGTLS